MYVFSTWLMVQAGAARVAEIAAQFDNPDTDFVIGRSGEKFRRSPRRFVESSQTPWQFAKTDGVRWTGIADLPIDMQAPTRLVGVLAPTEASLADLRARVLQAVGDEGAEAEEVRFSLRALLGPSGAEQGLTPTSIRLNDDDVDVVIQSPDDADLRERMGEMSGEVTGITLERLSDNHQLTVFESGTVVFDELASPSDILSMMGALQIGIEVPAKVY